MKKSKVMSIALTLALTMSASLVPNIAFAKKANEKGVLTIADFSDPIDLCPFMSSDNASGEVTQYVFSGLLKYNNKGVLVPACAAAMPTVSKDNKVITFKLRKDVKWHDGKPMTSADVKFSYDLITNPKAATTRAGEFRSVTKIEAPNPYTVIFYLKEVNAKILGNFASGYIVPMHLWKNVPLDKIKQNELNKKPVGNGPYKFVEWKSGERVVLEAFKDYYDGKPKVSKIIKRINGTQAVAMVQVETGEANYVDVPESDLGRMKQKPNVNVHVADAPVFDALVYNNKSPFFSDKRVRQAFSHAVNKQAIVKGIYKGVGSPTDSTINPSNYAYEPNVKKYSYDLKKANALLDQAGWKRGADGIRVKDGKKFEFPILTNKGNIMREKMTVVLQAQLKLIGVKAEPRILEWNTFLNRYVKVGKYDAYVGGYTIGLDPDQSSIYHSNKKLEGYLNNAQYANKEVDKLLEAGLRTFNTAERKKIYSKMQKVLAEDVPMTYIVARKQGFAVTKNIQGVKAYPILGTNGEEINWTIN